jgi:hypothetical protein
MNLDGDGPWKLDVEGFEVMEVRSLISFLQITASGEDAAAFKIKLEGAFDFRDPNDGSQSLDPLAPEALAATAALSGDMIRAASFTSRSELHIEFASGYSLDCACNGKYESWSVSAPDGVFVVGVPGGGAPAIWR